MKYLTSSTPSSTHQQNVYQIPPNEKTNAPNNPTTTPNMVRVVPITSIPSIQHLSYLPQVLQHYI